MLAELGKYWGAHPPIHILAAAYLGYGATAKKTLTPEEEKRQLIDELSQVGKGKITLKNG